MNTLSKAAFFALAILATTHQATAYTCNDFAKGNLQKTPEYQLKHRQGLTPTQLQLVVFELLTSQYRFFQSPLFRINLLYSVARKFAGTAGTNFSRLGVDLEINKRWLKGAANDAAGSIESRILSGSLPLSWADLHMKPDELGSLMTLFQGELGSSDAREALAKVIEEYIIQNAVNIEIGFKIYGTKVTSPFLAECRENLALCSRLDRAFNQSAREAEAINKVKEKLEWNIKLEILKRDREKLLADPDRRNTELANQINTLKSLRTQWESFGPNPTVEDIVGRLLESIRSNENHLWQDDLQTRIAQISELKPKLKESTEEALKALKEVISETSTKNSKLAEEISALKTALNAWDALDPSEVEIHARLLNRLEEVISTGENILRHNDLQLKMLKITEPILQLELLGTGLGIRFRKVQKELLAIQKRIETIRTGENRDAILESERKLLQAYTDRDASALKLAADHLQQLRQENIIQSVVALNKVSTELTMLKGTSSIWRAVIEPGAPSPELYSRIKVLLSETQMGLIHFVESSLNEAVQNSKGYDPLFTLASDILQTNTWPETEPKVISELRARTK